MEKLYEHTLKKQLAAMEERLAQHQAQLVAQQTVIASLTCGAVAVLPESSTGSGAADSKHVAAATGTTTITNIASITNNTSMEANIDNSQNKTTTAVTTINAGRTSAA